MSEDAFDTTDVTRGEGLIQVSEALNVVCEPTNHQVRVRYSLCHPYSEAGELGALAPSLEVLEISRDLKPTNGGGALSRISSKDLHAGK